MRALVSVVGAVVALGVLAGCGERAEPGADAGAGKPTTSASTGKPAPSTPSPTDLPTSEDPAPPPKGGKPQQPSSGQPPVTIGPDGPVVPAGVTEVPAAQIDASAVPDYYEYGNRVWSFDNGMSLQMFAMASSGCTDAEAVLADQSADSIKVMLRPMDSTQGGRPDDSMCATVMTPRPVVVTLDTPLKDRKIYLSAGR